MNITDTITSDKVARSENSDSWKEGAIETFNSLLPHLEKLFDSKRISRAIKNDVFFRFNIQKASIRTSKDKKKIDDAYAFIRDTINENLYSGAN